MSSVLAERRTDSAAGELVIFFKPELAGDFDFRLKQGGQLASKSRVSRRALVRPARR